MSDPHDFSGSNCVFLFKIKPLPLYLILILPPFLDSAFLLVSFLFFSFSLSLHICIFTCSLLYCFTDDNLLFFRFFCLPIKNDWSYLTNADTAYQKVLNSRQRSDVNQRMHLKSIFANFEQLKTNAYTHGIPPNMR